jgi:hypothetical protein
MLQNYYYPRTIRGILVAFSDLFNDLKVYTYNSVVSGDVSAATKEIDVDILFGPGDKVFLSRSRNVNVTARHKTGKLPMLSIIPRACVYDPERSHSSNDVRHWIDLERSTELQEFFSDVMPVPYNYNFDVKIKCAEWDHVIQIMENILPHFNPVLHLSVREISFLNWRRDLPVEMKSGPDFNFKDVLDEGDRREIEVDMSFVVKGLAYRPFATASMIRIINTKYYINEFTTSAVDPTHDVLVNAYSTSGFQYLSAIPNPNDYTTSGYSPISEMYWFTSASDYT